MRTQNQAVICSIKGKRGRARKALRRVGPCVTRYPRREGVARWYSKSIPRAAVLLRAYICIHFVAPRSLALLHSMRITASKSGGLMSLSSACSRSGVGKYSSLTLCWRESDSTLVERVPTNARTLSFTPSLFRMSKHSGWSKSIALTGLNVVNNAVDGFYSQLKRCSITQIPFSVELSKRKDFDVAYFRFTLKAPVVSDRQRWRCPSSCRCTSLLRHVHDVP